MSDYVICDGCHFGIYPGDEALLIGDEVVHVDCADEMLEEGKITQDDLDNATPYDVEEQASYREQYRNPWSW